MKENTKKGVSRREFLGLSALGLASLTILPSWAIDGVRIAPSDRVVLGFIGLGQQALSDFKGFAACPGVQVAACCDVDTMKTERFRRRVAEWQASKGMNQRCEGLAMVKAVRNNKRVLQVGSQQRSSREFQAAIDMVQNGAIGHIEKIYARVGEPPTPLSLPEMPVPANLNFNQWMGPLNDPKIHYHPDLCPPISLDPEENEKLWGAWRWFQETGNGYTADWGAHMFDIAQAAIGMDGSGPVEFTPKGYNGTQYSTMRYANGIVMTEQPYLEDNPDAQGIKFVGDNGWIEVARGYINCSDQSNIPSDLKNLIEKRPRMMTPEERKKMYEEYMKKLKDSKKKGNDAGNYETSAPHMQNFIDCVRSRENPIAPVEVGCSTNTLCCLQNIARELGRPVKWNPATLSFGNDKEAASHRLYWYQYRNPYSLPYFCK